MLRSWVLVLAVVAAGFGSPAQAASAEKAAAFVQKIGDEAVSILGTESLTKQEKQHQLEKVFARAVDIPWVGKFVLGRFWRLADAAQRERYMREYRDFVISHYASRFAQYSGGDFKIVSSRPDGSGQFVVTMEITSPQEEVPVMVDYRVHNGKNSLQVFDVIVEGVSMITTQRAEFNSVLSQKGLNYLIAQLADKTEALGRPKF